MTKIKLPRTKKVINKLILIGNGFDLAIGMKTSYNDFLFWYLRNLLITSVKKTQHFNDGANGMKYFYFKDQLTTTYWRSFNEQDKLLEFIDKYDTLDALQKILKENTPVIIEQNSFLLRKIYDSSLNSWIDIENSYYEILKSNIKDKTSIEKLNSDFSFLKEQLEVYLTSLEIPSFQDIPETSLFSKQFYEAVKEDEIIASKSKTEDLITENTCFLNFNYTNSLKNLLESANKFYGYKKKYTINHIHGKLNATDEKVIFGYGDEMDNKYEEIQDLNDNLYLENIKSFQYFRSPNYRTLLRFVSSNEYQVCIYGHSCGLSDRVMLNEIFENENCKSIKVYYYKDENDFNNKTMEISRHFKDNNSMRTKIVNFNPNNVIPQFSSFFL